MKSVLLLLVSSLALTWAAPQATTTIEGQCDCEPRICPLELKAECECRNSAAQDCWKSKLEAGVTTCPSPTPRVCTTFYPVAARADPTGTPSPTEDAKTCECEPMICAQEWPQSCYCSNANRKSCYEKCGGAEPAYQQCPATSTLVTVTAAPTTTYQACGGFAGLPCPTGQVCVDDPRDRCEPAKGGADCAGICVWPSATATIKF